MLQKLYHWFTLSYPDVEELHLERGIRVTRESIRTWCINFSNLFAQGLGHWEGTPGFGVASRRYGMWTWAASPTGYGGPLTNMALCWTLSFSGTAILRQPSPSLSASWVSTTFQRRSTPTSSGVMGRPFVSFPCPTLWSTSRWSPRPAATTSWSNPTVPHDDKNASNADSGHDDAHRDFSTCTPALRICTTQPAATFQLTTVVTTSNGRSRSGAKWCGRRPEVQAACNAEDLQVLGRPQLATTVTLSDSPAGAALPSFCTRIRIKQDQRGGFTDLP